MRVRFIFLIVPLLISGCWEYQASYDFVVTNNLPVTIRFKADEQFEFRNSDTLTIQPSESIKVAYENGSTVGKDEHPDDIRNRYWIFDSLYVIIADSVYDSNVASKDLWSYSTEPQIGTYTLEIDSVIISLK